MNTLAIKGRLILLISYRDNYLNNIVRTKFFFLRRLSSFFFKIINHFLEVIWSNYRHKGIIIDIK